MDAWCHVYKTARLWYLLPRRNSPAGSMCHSWHLHLISESVALHTGQTHKRQRLKRPAPNASLVPLRCITCALQYLTCLHQSRLLSHLGAEFVQQTTVTNHVKWYVMHTLTCKCLTTNNVTCAKQHTSFALHLAGHYNTHLHSYHPGSTHFRVRVLACPEPTLISSPSPRSAACRSVC